MNTYFNLNEEKLAKMLIELNDKQKEVYEELCNRLEFDKEKPNTILMYWAKNVFSGVSCQRGSGICVDDFKDSDLHYMYENCCPIDKDSIPWLNTWQKKLKKARGRNSRENMIDVGVYGLRREDYGRYMDFRGFGAKLPTYVDLVSPPYDDYAEILGLEKEDVVSAFSRLRDCGLIELQRWREVIETPDGCKRVWFYVFVPKGVDK